MLKDQPSGHKYIYYDFIRLLYFVPSMSVRFISYYIHNATKFDVVF